MAEESPPPEDSLRHLRCRGMTSQGFPLEMPILKRNSRFKIQNSKFIFDTTLFWSTFISTSFHILERSEKMTGISRGKLTENLH